MKCWNCNKEIPNGAKSCSYCERGQNRPPIDPKVALEVLSKLDPESLRQLGALMNRHGTLEDLANAIFADRCPACGSERTETCEDVMGIDSIMVGRCIECGEIFCTECRQMFENDVVTISSRNCPVCGSSDTDFPTDEDVDCAVREKVSCHSCGVDYCLTCGKPLTTMSENDMNHDPDDYE